MTSFIGFWLNAYYSGRFLGYGFTRQSVDVLPYLGVAIIMAACVWLAALIPIDRPFLQLVTQVAVGVVVYVALCAGLRLPGFVNAWDMVRPVLERRLFPVRS